MKEKESWQKGFNPVIDKNSKVLILGSFPSVKSKLLGFYYGNPQNRFWKVLELFFDTKIPSDIEGKKEFLIENKIALWDVIEKCKIFGSADSDINKNNSVAVDINKLINDFPNIKAIICNGKKSFSVFNEFNSNCNIKVYQMPSTSSANVRFDMGIWQKTLKEIFS